MTDTMSSRSALWRAVDEDVTEESAGWTPAAEPSPWLVARPLSPTVAIGIRPIGGHAEPPAWLPAIVERFSYLFALGPNWNSHGAQAIQPASAVLAVRVLLAVQTEPQPLPFIAPTADGGAQLEWHDGGIDLEINIDPKGPVEVWFRDSAEGKEWEGDLSHREVDVRRALETLTSRRSAGPTAPGA
jgi:hypothetical protein